jgi:DNA-directed RNA polymerase subunit RPC12/RpoP
MLKLICNMGCGKEFILIDVGSAIVRDDIHKSGFSCPHCGKEYITHYSNTGIRSLQKILQEQKGLPQSKRRQRLIQDLIQRIAIGMDRLQQQMEAELSTEISEVVH